MARDRKRFNVKGRQSHKNKKGETEGNANQQTSVQVDNEVFNGEKFDASNPLLLPSKKKEKEKSSWSSAPGKKFLTRKQRKKLEAIVDRKKKKGGRAELLEELQKHQLSPQTFATLTPLVKIQTEGLKKLFAQIQKDKEREEKGGLEELEEVPEKKKIQRRLEPRSSIKGANRNKFQSWSGRFSGEDNKMKDDPKVLGFEEKTSSSEDEEMDEEVEIKSEVEEEELEAEDMEEEEVIVEENNPLEDVAEEAEVKLEEPKPEVMIRVPKTFVSVNRTKEIESVRSKLPIIPEEQVIMEAITHNAVTVLAGETGSGKTTQVPQFLYEAGYALNGKMIGVTEPRRVAAIAMSMRVGKELNISQKLVSYQIRFDGNTSSKTQIKFMTDGVLLKEMERDFLLTKYSAICIDEAHERSLYTDLLIGLLSRCVTLRQKRKDPLKLIIMSATMRVEDFVENPVLFKTPPPLIHVPTRQFPVQIHFAKHTPENYVMAVYKKAMQIHRKLPPGGILIFLTGQQEVRTVVKQLTKRFPSADEKHVPISPDKKGKSPLSRKNKKSSPVTSTTNLRTFDLDKLQKLPLKSEEEEESEESEEDMDEWGGDGEDDDEDAGCSDPLHVLPLYSMLPSKEQQRVFDTPPEGSRLCVVATNVAETSLTIPSIRYVVDCGKVKLKMWDKLTGVEQFNVTWESKASAEQRAGRAGRTGPGHCYRIFSSALFDSDFAAYSKPEIQVRPVDDMMLLMKSMGIDRVQHFPYPSPPANDQLVAAEKSLIALGALESSSNKAIMDDNTLITELGKTMAFFPLGPRFSKMVALSFHHSLVEYTIALVSALTVQEVFLDAMGHESSKNTKSHWAALRRKWAGTGSCFLLGDCMVLLRAVGAFEYGGGSPDFCLKTGLRYKAMVEIRKLRKQITSEVNLLVSSGQEVPLNPHMEPPTDQQSTLLRQIILSGLPDRIARKILDAELKEGEDPKIYKHAYRCGELDDPVFIHSSSSLRTANPLWVVYQQVFESNGKMYLRGVTSIEPEWISTFCKSLCKMENPLKDPPPYYDEEKGTVYCSVKATYGKQGWELPIVQIEYPRVLDKFKLFAQFLLEGQVFPKLEKTKGNLLSMPVTMTKTWAKLQPRTQTFLTALTSSGIHTKNDLAQRWKDEPKFLLKEYLEWIPEDLQSQVTLEWPPLELDLD